MQRSIRELTPRDRDVRVVATLARMIVTVGLLSQTALPHGIRGSRGLRTAGLRGAWPFCAGVINLNASKFGPLNSSVRGGCRAKAVVLKKALNDRDNTRSLAAYVGLDPISKHSC
jgi:hypothetical protein